MVLELKLELEEYSERAEHINSEPACGNRTSDSEVCVDHRSLAAQWRYVGIDVFHPRFICLETFV
jgi:hypothetical protein